MGSELRELKFGLPAFETERNRGFEKQRNACAEACCSRKRCFQESEELKNGRAKGSTALVPRISEQSTFDKA